MRFFKSCYPYFLGVVVLGAGVAESALASEESVSAGTALAQRVYDRENGRNASSRGVMVLEEKGRPARERKLYTYRLDKGKGDIWSLVRFVSPADISGVGLLTLDHPGDNSDQWLYLPELDKSRRVSSDRKGGKFVGSDIYFEDMQDREPSMDWHNLTGRQVFQNQPCEVLESTPRKADNSVYSKRIGCVHLPSLIPLWVDFYRDGKQEPSKRMVVNRFDKVSGIWTVLESTMSDLEKGTQTRLRIEKVVYNGNLQESLFSRQALEDQAVEKAFRP